MEDAGDGLAGHSRGIEDDFRSCCGDEEEWEDTEESFTAGIADEELDEISVRLFFKGVSSSSDEPEGKKLSGIAVVMERSPGVPVLRVQKKLDFYRSTWTSWWPSTWRSWTACWSPCRAA
jgi:hypothetical protein